MANGAIGQPRPRGTRRAASRGGCRRGCTLVELVVALVLTTVALLAMLGASALLVREVGAEAAETRALAAARGRLDALAAVPCDERAAGIASHGGGVAEAWWAEAGVVGVQLLVDSVTMPAPGGPRAVVVRTAARC